MVESINYIFFGCTNYSLELIKFLVKNNRIPKVIFSIPQEFEISYNKEKVRNYNHGNMEVFAKEHNIKYYEVDSIDGKRTKDYYNVIESMNPDLILVLGWYYMVPKKIREIAKYGAWGIHASLLPKYAGGAPLNWAIINGEEETGVTLFRMESGVDDGDIIDQKKITIDFNDTIKEVYDKAINASKELLKDVFENPSKIVFTPQDKSKIEVWPQRKPEDGEIDLTKSSKEIYNFIRAQSSPYPGAYIKCVDNKRLVIDKAHLIDGK